MPDKNDRYYTNAHNGQEDEDYKDAHGDKDDKN